MKKSRIVHFDDEPTILTGVAEVIDVYSDGRHRVIANAETLDDALGVLKGISEGAVDANIVLTDANLTPGQPHGYDVRVILGRVAELGLPVRTVLLSSETAASAQVNPDASLLKGCANEDIVEVLDQLPELEP